MRPVTTLAILLISTAAQAQTFGPGNHLIVVGEHKLLVTVLDSPAKVTISRLKSVVTLGTPTPDKPDPVKPDPVKPVTGLAATIKAASDAVTGDPRREESAAALAVVYQQGADHIKAGTIKTPRQATEWARLGSDIALKETGARTTWQPVRETIGRELDTLIRKGQLGSTADYGATFKQVADGLGASAGQSAAFDLAKLLDLLAKLLPVIIALFRG